MFWWLCLLGRRCMLNLSKIPLKHSWLSLAADAEGLSFPNFSEIGSHRIVYMTTGFTVPKPMHVGNGLGEFSWILTKAALSTWSHWRRAIIFKVRLGEIGRNNKKRVPSNEADFTELIISYHCVFLVGNWGTQHFSRYGCQFYANSDWASHAGNEDLWSRSAKLGFQVPWEWMGGKRSYELRLSIWTVFWLFAIEQGRLACRVTLRCAQMFSVLGTSPFLISCLEVFLLILRSSLFLEQFLRESTLPVLQDRSNGWTSRDVEIGACKGTSGGAVAARKSSSNTSKGGWKWCVKRF